jgi:hypothetical protein
MKIAIAFGITGTLAACVPMAPRLYVPNDFRTTSQWGRNCQPEQTATLVDKNGTVLRLTTTSFSSNMFRGRLQLNAPQATSVQFVPTRLEIRSAQINDTISVALKGSGCEGSGGTRNQLDCFFATEVPEQNALEVVVPSLEVDGVRQEVAPVGFHLQRVPMIVGACQ